MTQLDELSDAAVVDAENDDNATRPPPFAAVVARAYRLDPTTFTPADIDAAPSPPADAVVPAAAPPSTTDEAWLRRFVVAAQREAEANIAYRMAQPLPAPRGPSRHAWRWVVASSVLIAAAAAVLLAMRLSGFGLLRDTDDRSPSQAAATVEHSTSSAEAEIKAPSRHRSRTERPEPQAPVPPKEPETTDGETVDPPPAREPALERRPGAERLRELDEQAQQQLARGDLGGADRTLERLIQLGGRHRLVELAYGDRFTIAHRRRDTRRQVALWRGYLRRFPRGKLADDARAGLCRHTTEDRQPGCWRRYLRDFPRGAYSSVARRESSAVGAAPP